MNITTSDAKIEYKDVSFVNDLYTLERYEVECEELTSQRSIFVVILNDNITYKNSPQQAQRPRWVLHTSRKTWGNFRRGKSRRTNRKSYFTTLEDAKAAAEKYIKARLRELRTNG